MAYLFQISYAVVPIRNRILFILKEDKPFFSVKLSNFHYTNKQRAYNIETKNMYKDITPYALNLMNHFKSRKVVKITNIK